MKILILGTLPPPKFGHSMTYDVLMSSSFADPLAGYDVGYDVKFLNMDFFSYDSNGKPTFSKIFKMIKYWIVLICVSLVWQPRYVMYNASWYLRPFWKDMLYCVTAILLGRRLVIHDHGQYVAELYLHTHGFKGKLLRWVLSHSHGAIVLGKKAKATYDGLMSLEKVFVVPGAVKPTVGVRARSGSRVKVLYFSYLSVNKGILIAFNVARIILKNYGKVDFTFAGPVENEQIERMMNELCHDYPDRVKYVGYIDSEVEKEALMKIADIFFFPTQKDVFGLVLLEAMREGLPIVASREGCIPEILNNGILVDKNNMQEFITQILRLVDDKITRDDMGRWNRKRYEKNYTVDIYGKRMIHVFKDMDGY